MFKLSQTSIDRLQGVDDRIIKIIRLALEITKIDFGIPEHGGLRTEQEQKALCDRGLSECDGYINKSYHQTGKAFDMFAYVDGASWDRGYMTQVAAAILQAASMLGYKLEWGGHWKNFVDLPHFQLKD